MSKLDAHLEGMQRPRAISLVVVVVGALVLNIALRAEASSDFYPFGLIFCDEQIYLSEAWRMVADRDVFQSDFRGGGLNYLLANFILAFGGVLSEAALFEIGRWIYAVVLPSATPVVTGLALAIVSRSVFAGAFTILLFSLSPLFMATGLYWYPDSYIGLFTSIVLLVWSTWKSGRISEVAFSRLSGVVLALGLSVKPTFAFILVFVLVLVVSAVEGKESFRGRVLESKTKIQMMAFWTLGVFLTLNYAVFLRPLFFLRDQMLNVLVYQRGGQQRDFVAGFEFYGSLLLLSVPFAAIVFLFYTTTNPKLNRLVQVAFGLLISYILVFSLQTQYLPRNLNLILPIFFFLLGLGVASLKNRQRSRPLFIGLITLTLLQTIWTSALAVTSAAGDPRQSSSFIDLVSQEPFVAVNDFCSSAGLPVDEVLKSPLSSETHYPLVLQFSAGTGLIGGRIHDPLSFRKGPFYGIETANRGGEFVLIDFFDLGDSPPPATLSGYKSTWIQGRHLSILVLESKSPEAGTEHINSEEE